MKALYLFLVAMFLSILSTAQVQIFSENFESPSGADSVTSSGTPGWSISNTLAYDGIQCDTSFVPVGDTSFLTTDNFNTSGNTYVILSFAHICKIEFFDGAIIQVSTDNGASWTGLTASEYLGTGQFATNGNRFNANSYPIDWQPGAPAAVPTNSWWKTEDFDISNLAGNQAQVKIRFALLDGNNNGAVQNYGWLLDAIKVVMAPSELIPPNITLLPPVYSGVVFNLGPYTPKAVITDNSGIDTAYVVYSVNSGISDTVGMSSLGIDTLVCQIPAVSDSDTVCWKVLAIDASPAQNMAMEPSSGCTSFVASLGVNFPYIDNFDIPNNLWSTSSSSGSGGWELGTPAYGATNTAHSPPNSWDINLSSTYSINARDTLFGPVFNFSTSVDPTLSFWINYNLESCCDGCWIEYTVDGISWQILGTYNDPNASNWYNRMSVSSSGGKPCWTNNSNGWTKCEYPLDFLSLTPGPIQFRFVFHSNGSGNYDGFSIDDFSITLPDAWDAELLEIVQPDGGCGLGNETVEIQIRNSGLDTIQGNLSASYQLTGSASVITEPISATIYPGDSLLYAFSTTVDLSVSLIDSTFELNAWVDLLNDTTHSNDSLKKDITSGHVPPDPIASNATIPYGTSVLLSASSPDSLFWYDVPAGGVEIATGANYQTPNLYDTTIFYVEARSGAPEIKLTEICHYQLGTGHTTPLPSWLTGDDFIEISNIGAAPKNLENWLMEVVGSTSITYTIPDVDLMAGEVMILKFSNGTDDPTNRLFHMGGGSVGSSSQAGYILKDPQGNIVDVVAMNGYTFLSGSGVTAQDWSGNLPPSGGIAGAIRTASDNNTASDWIIASATNLQTIGSLNPFFNTSGGNGCGSNRLPVTVFVTGFPAVDVGTELIINPNTGIDLSSNESVTIKLKNYGTNSVSNIPVHYRIGLGSVVSDTIIQTILPGDTLIYTFSQTANLFNYATYNFAAYTTLNGDTYSSNDTAYKTVINEMITYCPSTATSPAAYEDIGFFSLSNIANGDSLPVFSNPLAVNGYSDFTQSLPAIQLAPGTSYPIAVSQIHISSSFYTCYINAFIDYDRDGTFDMGTENVFGAQTSNNMTTVYGNVNVPLTATSGFTRMRVVLREGGTASSTLPCGTYTWGETEDYLVMISPIIPNDAGVIEIIQPGALTNEGDSQDVECVFRNYGSDTLTSVDITYLINGSNPVTQNWTGQLIPGAQDTIMMPAFIVPPGNCNICAHTTLANDSNTFNDQTCKAFYGIPKIDLGVSMLVAPSSGACYSTNETVIVRLKNYGSDTIYFTQDTAMLHSSVSGPNPITFPIIQIDTAYLAVGDSVDFVVSTTYDMSIVGDYDFDAYTIVTADGDPTNNAMPTTTINSPGAITPNPYIEDFETFITGSPGTFQNGWTIEPSSAYRWQVDNGGTSSSNTGPELDHTTGTTNGIYIYTEGSSGTQGDEAMLISPCIDLSGMQYPKLKFYYHMYGSDIVSMHVDINYGGVWVQDIWTMVGAQQSSTTDAWGEALVDLSAYTGIVKIRFRGIKGLSFACDMAVDDINIFQPLPNDAGVTEILFPQDINNEGVTQNVEVVVENFGTDTIYNMSVLYSLNGNSPVSTNWTGALAPSVSDTIQLQALTVLPGSNDICAFTQLGGDINTYNDSTCNTFFGLPKVVMYFNDFETQTNGWWAPFGTKWEWGVPAASTINQAFSPDKVWAINLDGNYLNNQNDYLYTPPFNFVNIQNATLSFSHWLHTEESSDGGSVEYSTNMGNTWLNLGFTNDPFGVNWFTHIFGGIRGWSGSSNGYISSVYDLSQFNNYPIPIYFRFHFKSNNSNNSFNGWALDDFAINVPQDSIDAGISTILTPGNQTLPGQTQTVSVRIKNYGTDTLTLIPLRYRIDNGSMTQEDWSGTLLPDSSVDFTFTQTYQTPSSPYRLCSYTSVLTDFYRFNDSTCMMIDMAPAPIDAGVVNIVEPVNTTFHNIPVTVKARIRNFGSNTLHSIDVAYKVGNQPPVIETWTGTIYPNNEKTFTFSTNYNAPLGTYVLCAYTILANDSVTSNDEYCTNLATGIDEENGNIRLGEIQPNPGKDLFHIPVYSLVNEDLSWDLINAIGQLIASEKTNINKGENMLELDLSGQKPGIYYVRFRIGQSVYNKKITIL